MAPLATLERSIDAALFPRADFWHMAPHSPRFSPGSKEWSHFSVLGANCDLLVNFSLMAGSEGTKPQMMPRLILLFSAADGYWDGDVETFSLTDTSIFEGLPDITLGRNTAQFTGQHYRILADLSSRDISATLDLHPVTLPVLPTNVRLSDTESVRWMVVPHLRANGEVTVAGCRYQIADAPAYHDRNWGRFAWGGAYAWEWATILPSSAREPWCLVYSRISNRHRGATLSQSLILWRREFPSRKFYGRDLSISHQGVLRREHVLRLPRIAALLVPGTAADVPQHLVVSARGYGDELTLRMCFDDFAQVVVPNDRWPGFTSLCEIKGLSEVVGRVGDERIAFEGRVQAELNHAVG
jgi:hypothetical protein